MAQHWEVWKDACYPGRVVVPGEDGPVAYTFTAADMAAMERTGREKLKDGWSVPAAWEHQEVGPEKVGSRVRLSRTPAERERDFARGVFGRVKDFARTPDGRLKVLIAGDDPDDLKQLHKVRFVSPQIDWDWQDTDGKVWAGPTVTHLAATPRPVQRHQHPVGTDPDVPVPTRRAGSLADAIRMSFGGSSRPGVGRRLRLSLDHYAEKPVADTTIDDLTGGGKKSAWERIAAALTKAGIKIGDGSNVKDPDHLADLIEVAAMNSEPDLDDEPIDDDEDAAVDGDLDTPPPGATEPPPPPIQMSLEAKRAIEARDGELIAMHRSNLLKRAERLGAKGYVPPAVSNDLLGRAKRVKLSLTANAKLAPTDVESEIAAYEKLAPNTAWAKAGRKPTGQPARTRLSQRGNRPALEEVDPPYRETSPQDDDAIVAAFERSVGRDN